MKTFFIVYGVIALILFFVLDVIAEWGCRLKNKEMIFDVYKPSILKVAFAALFFPLAIPVLIIRYVINQKC